MAFSYTVNDQYTMGNAKVVTGTYTNDSGSTGGDIKTALNVVNALHLQPKGTAISANQPVVNETMPLNKGDVTIVTSANEVGTWIAIGY